MAENYIAVDTNTNTGRNEHKRSAATKPRKGLWARYIDRLAATRCTLTPPECR